MSRVDVIIPCYNYGHFLRECVESVLTQRGVDIRILILDDASPDNTPEVAATLLAGDPRIEYRRHSVNRGHVATFNEGLAWAQGDYTVLLSADDMLTPGALGRAARLMDEHTEVGLTYGPATKFPTGEPLPAAVMDDDRHEITRGADFIRNACATGLNPIPTPAGVLVRTSVQKQVGEYRYDLPHTNDMEMWLRIAVYAPIGSLMTHQAHYRQHGQNMSRQYYDERLQDFRQRRAAFDCLFQYHGDRIANRNELAFLAAESVAVDAFWTANNAFDRGDAKTVQHCLDFALAACPHIRKSPHFARLRWKRRIGTTIWPLIRPLVDRLKRRRPAAL